MDKKLTHVRNVNSYLMRIKPPHRPIQVLTEREKEYIRAELSITDEEVMREGGDEYLLALAQDVLHLIVDDPRIR